MTQIPAAIAPARPSSGRPRGKTAPQVISDATAVFRPKAAAIYTGLTVSWFKADRRRKEGPTVPYVQLSAGAIGYRRIDLDQLIVSRLRGVTADAA